MSSLQQLFASNNKVIDIPRGEYEGPLTINHACIVNGNGATIWVKSGTALIVNSAKVALNDLRIEITNDTDNTLAIKLKKDTLLKRVEVYGQEDIEGQHSNWAIPRMIDLGSFAPNKTNEFYRRMQVNSACRIINNVHGLEVIPLKLSTGTSDVLFKVSSLMDGTILYGDIILETDYGINKRVYITGRAISGFVEVHETRVSNNAHITDRNSVEYLNNIQNNDKNTSNMVVKGQRISLDNKKTLFVAFQGEGDVGDIDPYAFMLDGDRKTRQDRDLVFFGNMQAKENGVYIDNKMGMQGVSICWKNIPDKVESVVVSFAIYEDERHSAKYFSALRKPVAKIYIDDDVYEFPLMLGLERVVSILEVYRYKGRWKVKFIGAGYTSGLRKLCEEYGLDVMG